MRHLLLLAALLTTQACAPVPAAQVTKARPAAEAAGDPAYPLMGLGDAAFIDIPAAAPRHGTAEVARSFMELTFAMESGRQLPSFSRFEGPITVAMAGQVPAGASAELLKLMGRLRAEAGIDIRAASPGAPASITIDFQPKSALRRLAPTAACFVVPNVSTLSEYRARRGTDAVDWANMSERRQAAIFVPADTSPQEVRDCLHEEMAQALGPLNDLYRLSDSVFNDDNFNSVLTDFDMLILRAYYAPELQSGMSRDQVAARISGVVARLNPGGGGMGGADTSPTPKAWTQAIETALGNSAGQSTRRAAAERALAIAQGQGWTDSRLAFSHFAIGRLFVGSDRGRAVAEFARAAEIYRRLPGGEVQLAHIDMQLAALAVASGQPEQALPLVDRAIPVVQRAENSALLATILLIKAQALEMMGRTAEADRLRLDSQAHARYGFGTDAQVRAREREIAALGLRGTRG